VAAGALTAGWVAGTVEATVDGTVAGAVVGATVVETAEGDSSAEVSSVPLQAGATIAPQARRATRVRRTRSPLIS
jgi:hypothetical protein